MKHFNRHTNAWVMSCTLVLLMIYTQLAWTQSSTMELPNKIQKDTVKEKADSLEKIPPRLKVKHFENITRQQSSYLYLRDYIRITVDSLQGFIKSKPQQAKIILYIDGIPFNKLEPEFTTDSTLTFNFQKTIDESETKTASDNSWDYFYKRPRNWTLSPKIISIGYSTGTAVKSNVKVALVIIQTFWYWSGVGIILVLLSISYYLTIQSSLLKDSSTLPPAERPYSLARTQFAFWLLLIGCSFILLWISSGELPLLTDSTLILLGISGGTSIVSRVIDNSQSLTERHQNKKSEGFLKDILSDENGISVHRLQMVMFTLILGFVFAHDVIALFKMPDFGTNLLLLMGISNGAYAGLKTSENAAPVVG